MKVPIVIPTHNEEGNLEALISELVAVLANNEETQDYELVIVNDNSADATPATAMENENVDIIAHPTGRISGEREAYDVDIDALLDAAVSTGTDAHRDVLD